MSRISENQDFFQSNKTTKVNKQKINKIQNQNLFYFLVSDWFGRYLEPRLIYLFLFEWNSKRLKNTICSNKLRIIKIKFQISGHRSDCAFIREYIRKSR